MNYLVYYLVLYLVLIRHSQPKLCYATRALLAIRKRLPSCSMEMKKETESDNYLQLYVHEYVYTSVHINIYIYIYMGTPPPYMGSPWFLYTWA